MWMIEEPYPPAILGALLAFAGAAVWNGTRRSVGIYLLLGGFLLGILAFGVDYLIETDREFVEQQVVELCWSFQKKDPATLNYISQGAPELRLLFSAAMNIIDVQSDLKVFNFESQLFKAGSEVEVKFRANATVIVRSYGDVGRQPALLVLSWRKEPEGWKIYRVQRLNPVNGTEMGILDQRSN